MIIILQLIPLSDKIKTGSKLTSVEFPKLHTKMQLEKKTNKKSQFLSKRRLLTTQHDFLINCTTLVGRAELQ